MPSSLMHKLQLKPDLKMVCVNAPSGIADSLRDELGEVTWVEPAPGAADAVLVFVNNLEEAGRLVPGN